MMNSEVSATMISGISSPRNRTSRRKGFGIPVRRSRWNFQEKSYGSSGRRSFLLRRVRVVFAVLFSTILPICFSSNSGSVCFAQWIGDPTRGTTIRLKKDDQKSGDSSEKEKKDEKPLPREEIKRLKLLEEKKNREEKEKRKREEEIKKQIAEETLEYIQEGRKSAEDQAEDRRIQEERKNLPVLKKGESEDSRESFVPYMQKVPQKGRNYLFDTKTFMGWRVQKEGPYGGGRFSIEEGMICSDPAAPGLLYTTGQFSDFFIDCEVQAEPGSDAFLLLRTSPDPKNLATSCAAVVIATSSLDESRKVGSLFGRKASVYSHGVRTAEGDHSPPWIKFSMSCKGNLVNVVYGNSMRNDLLDPNIVQRGYVGFLVTRGKVRIRNVFWGVNRSYPLLDSRELESWNFLGSGKNFSANMIGNVLRFSGGPGGLESKNQYKNFVLSADFRTMNEGVESGLFFRSTPGILFSGYQCQINNRPSPENRKSEPGWDTGGLFGLVNPRYVGALDEQWNSLVLKAVDDHIQIWINGIQTVDYFDRRPPVESEDSKSEGRRLFPGPVQIEGYDPSTFIEFQTINITTIQDRRPSLDQRNYFMVQ